MRRGRAKIKTDVAGSPESGPGVAVAVAELATVAAAEAGSPVAMAVAEPAAEVAAVGAAGDDGGAPAADAEGGPEPAIEAALDETVTGPAASVAVAVAEPAAEVEAAAPAVAAGPAGEFDVVFAKGLGGQAIKLRDTRRDRPDDAWASLIATSSWVKPGEPTGAAAADGGINPYRTTTKARRISNLDIASLCALPSVETKDDRMSRVAVEAAPTPPTVRQPGPSRSQVVAALASVAVAAAREAAEVSAATAIFDRWAEGEGAWSHDLPAGGPPPDEAFAAGAASPAALAAGPVEKPPAGAPEAARAPDLSLAAVAAIAEPVATAPAPAEPAPIEPASPAPALMAPAPIAATMSPATPSPAAVPVAPLPSPAAVEAVAAAKAPTAPPAPAPAPAPAAVAAARASGPAHLPAGSRQVRTLLFDDGPLFSSHPVLVTVIIEPLPQPDESPPAQPAILKDAARPAAPREASRPPSPADATSPAPAVAGRRGGAARAQPATVSLLGGVVGLGVSFGRAVGGVLGLGGPAPAAGGQKKSGAAQGGGGKVRPSGVQGNLRR